MKKFKILFEGSIVHASNLTAVGSEEFNTWVDRLMGELQRLAYQGGGIETPAIIGNSIDAQLQIAVCVKSDLDIEAVLQGGSAIIDAATNVGLLTTGVDLTKMKVEGPLEAAPMLRGQLKELIAA